MTRRASCLLLLVLAGTLLGGAPATAHPLDETVQQLYVSPSRSGLGVQLDVSPNVLVAPAVARGIDTDGDGGLSAAETAAHTALVRSALSVTAGGRDVDLRLVEARYPPLALLAAGGGTITLHWTGDLPPGPQALRVTDRYAPSRTIVQAVVLQPTDPVPVAHIDHADDGRTLTAALDGAPDPTPEPAVGTTADPAVDAGPGEEMFDALRRPLASPWSLVALLGVCALLGALHALTPGHGKALLAAYLVGERGTPGNAVVLGLVTTATHTAAVLALGTAVLVAGRFVLPDTVVPLLTLGAGLAVLVLGLRLVHQRRHATVEEHGHGHGHGHGHPEPGVLLTRTATPATPRRVAAMGVSAGIVPCPEALGVLLLAVGVGRTALGLAMIVAFSVGLAAVLVGLGLALVTVGPRLPRPTGERARGLLARVPLVSAVVVAALGAVMAVTGIASLAG